MFENTFKNIDDILHKDAGCSSELEEAKLETLLEIKYADVFQGVKTVGNGEVSKVRSLFLNFQKNLYLPHDAYSSVG